VVDVESELTALRKAVADFMRTAEAQQDRWHTPRAPGKWSPSQVAEHVARAIDESANDVAGRPTKFPRLPFFLKPVARALLFDRTLRRGALPPARTGRAFNPSRGAETVTEARERLEEAQGRFEDVCRVRSQSRADVKSVIFGTVPLLHYIRFQQFHTRHHEKQLPPRIPGSG